MRIRTNEKLIMPFNPPTQHDTKEYQGILHCLSTNSKSLMINKLDYLLPILP